jgi:hypothetical protein
MTKDTVAAQVFSFDLNKEKEYSANLLGNFYKEASSLQAVLQDSEGPGAGMSCWTSNL